jgi:hypothetical protein
MRNMDVRRSLVIAVATLAFAGGGTSLVLASGGGSALHSGAAKVQYNKPGCGPDKTDGVAGASGQHTGQPPKDQSRGDCPNPPGQQGNTTGTGNNNVSSSTSTSSNGNKKK